MELSNEGDYFAGLGIAIGSQMKSINQPVVNALTDKDSPLISRLDTLNNTIKGIQPGNVNLIGFNSGQEGNRQPMGESAGAHQRSKQR